MSDWNKLVSFSNSKQANAILFLLVCVILVIVLFRQPSNNYIGGQRDGKGIFMMIPTLVLVGISGYILYLIILSFNM